MILSEVAVVPGTDGRKMSKSYGNTIPLFSTREEIQKAVMGIVTDSSGERPEHVYAIHKLLKSDAELEPLYEEHKGKYKALKDALVDDLESFIKPMREKRASLAEEPDTVIRVLKEGKAKASEKADKKMTDIRLKVGVA